MPDALLTVSQLNAHYGQSHVLQGVSLQVERGSVVGLLGRNGAGKTTTLKAIMGIVPASGGSIRFDGSELSGQPPHMVARKGIAYVPEDRGIFPSLSVDEHFVLGRAYGSTGAGWSLHDVFALFPRLEERRSVGGGQLSGGEQQMLSIARALLLNPRLLILDEPSEGLAPVVIQEIGAVLEKLKSAGLTILLVEQNYRLAQQLSDRISVLGKGQIRWQGAAGELERDTDVKHTWLGI